MSTAPLLDRGTAIRIRVDLRDTSDALANADSITCQILNPTGTTYQTATSMTNSSTGVYLYDKQTSESDASGIYTIVVRSTTGGFTSLLKEDGFILE